MPAAATNEQFLETLRRSGLVDGKALDAYLESQRAAGALPEAPPDLARALVRDGLLTNFQANQILQGKARGFVLNGKYKLLEHLGAGGMGTVYLCEHISMRRRVAIKVLPVAKVRTDDSYLERFYREARAVAALDHPNIVRAHDIDRDDKLHFLVMEYIDGASLQEIIGKHGAMDVTRAAHYMAQAALGLQHAHEGGLVHRDIKPGNILVDRGGTVKILDMGLARFFHDDDQLSKKYDETVLGTSDYLAPEQTLGSDVDIRADIYSLGATFYYCLTGQTLFGEGTAAQKLIWHTTRQPKPIQSIRPEVPEELAELVEKRMLAKDPAQRFQQPIEVFEALAAWTATPIPPPPEDEMPKLSRAAVGPGDGASGPITPGSLGTSPVSARRGWTVAGASSPHPGRGPATSRRPTPSQPLPAPPTRVAGRNGPATTVPGGGPGKGSGVRGLGSGVKGPRSGSSSEVDISEGPTDVRPSSKRRRGKSSRTRRREEEAGALSPRILLIVGAAVLGPLVLAVLGVGVWLVWRPAPNRSPNPSAGAGAQRPPQPPQNFGAGGVAGVTISDERGAHRVKATRYDAVVENDGCVSSLRIGGTELLHFGGGNVRGCYFARPNGTALKLGAVQLQGGGALAASSPEASVRYEFGPDSLTWMVSNHTRETLHFLMVFDPDVKVVGNDGGEYARTPATRDWRKAVFFAGQSRLVVEGGDGLPEPVEHKYQAYVLKLGPGVQRLFLHVGDALPGELAHVRQLLAEHRVQKPGYEAVVAGDGCLTSLRLAGTEVLWVGPKTSRGAFFRQGDRAMRLDNIEESGPDAVTARTDRAWVRYEFGPDTLTLTLGNPTEGPLTFQTVFGPAVTAVGDGRGEARKVPVNRDGKTAVFYAGRSKLTVTADGTRLWGPWSMEPGPAAQVWEATLAPRETKTVVFKVAQVSDAEAARLPR